MAETNSRSSSRVRLDPRGQRSRPSHRRRLLALFEIEGSEITLGASIGIALAPRDGAQPELLIHKADLALYRDKEAKEKRLNRHGGRSMLIHVIVAHATAGGLLVASPAAVEHPAWAPRPSASASVFRRYPLV